MCQGGGAEFISASIYNGRFTFMRKRLVFLNSYDRMAGVFQRPVGMGDDVYGNDDGGAKTDRYT